MVKTIKKLSTLVMVMCVMLTSTVFAADSKVVEPKTVRSQSYTRSFSDSFSDTYRDEYGVSHRIYVTATCQAEIEWEDGISGWIVVASFPRPSVSTDDGETLGVSYYGTIYYGSSTASQRFKVSNADKYIYEQVSCDEYGDSSFYAEFEKENLSEENIMFI